MSKYPQDRFDEIPEDLTRVGAHRAPGKPGQGWKTFGWAALVTGVLVALGAGFILVGGGKFDINALLNPTTAPTATAKATAKPTQDATLLVNVFNGGPIEGLAVTVGDQLAAEGWQIGTKVNSGQRDIKLTTVFYGDPTLEGAARGLCQSVGEPCAIDLTDAYIDSAAQLTLVLGEDYKAAK